LTLFGSILVYAWKIHRALGRSPLRYTSASLIGFFVIIMIFNLKGCILDFDPVNVFFWVYVGLLFKLSDFSHEHRRQPSA
jgi:hypothetical protein